MELDQVRTFLAVLAHRGFHRAAQALHVSQPAVSARIRGLEDSLGTKLFAREESRLALSASGRAFQPHAEHLLQAVARARQAVQEQDARARGALRIGAALSIATYFLPRVIQKYRSEHYGALLSLRSGTSAEVLKMVLSGQVDLGMARSLNTPEIETITLRDDPLLLVGHPAHPALRQRRATLEQVKSWPLIFFDRGSSDWTLTQGLFRSQGLLPNVVLEVEGIETAKRMVERKLGLSFLPSIAVAHELRRGHLAAVKITGAEPLHRHLDVIYPRHSALARDAQDFLRLLEAAAISTRPRVTRTAAGSKKPAR